jgi:hypothetical protein
MAFGVTPPLTADSVADTARTAALAAIPKFSDVAPKAEGGTAALGSTQMIPYADHVHPRLTATANGQLDANGNATVVFTQAFDNEPSVTINSRGAKVAGTSIPNFDFEFVLTGGKITGCTVSGRRSRALPQQTQVSALAVLTGVITGVNNLATSLTGYDTTEPAANAKFSLIAVKTSAGT